MGSYPSILTILAPPRLGEYENLCTFYFPFTLTFTAVIVNTENINELLFCFPPPHLPSVSWTKHSLNIGYHAKGIHNLKRHLNIIAFILIYVILLIRL